MYLTGQLNILGNGAIPVITAKYCLFSLLLISMVSREPGFSARARGNADE